MLKGYKDVRLSGCKHWSDCCYHSNGQSEQVGTKASDRQGSSLRSIMAVREQREQRGRRSRGERNSERLKNQFLKSNTVKKNVLNVSQIVQIMVGVFNVVLGPERAETFPYWLGVPVSENTSV